MWAIRGFIRSFAAQVVCICMFFCGCGSLARQGSTASQQEEFASQLVARRLVQTYGQVTNAAPRGYVSYIVERLVSAAPAKLTPQPEVILLDTPTLGAYSGAGHYIILTRGLALTLASEGELAFVLAHEMAHRLLAHFNEGNELSDSTISDTALQREIAADTYALGLLERAGFAPASALAALRSVKARFAPSTAARLSLIQRENNVALKLRTMTSIIPAVTTSNDYRQFRADISYPR